MAHELAFANGRASMAYVGAVPWHGLGQNLTEDQPIEVWLAEAGMDYRVCRSRVRFGDDANPQIWEARHVLFRSDNKHPLGLVSDGYQIVQPRDVLEFFRDLCAKYGFLLETAGVLFEGARYWALARVPHGFTLKGDEVRGYILLATSADGSLATTAKNIATRVVCNNTLGVGMSEKSKHAVKVRHSTVFDPTAVKVDMGLLEEGWAEFGAKCERLASTPLTKKQALNILIAAMGDPNKDIDDQPNKRPMASILDLFDGKAIGSDLESSRGTAWGLVNAATEYYDHHAGRGDNSRLSSAWFGPASATKTAVFQKALLTTVLDAPAHAGLLDDVLSQPIGA
jgi:phage/plasmid-like protein (TIGR03299 family)